MIAPVVTHDELRELSHAALVHVGFTLDGTDPLEAYTTGHLPGAAYVDLDRWLAGPATAGSGRHPLPSPEVFAEGMGRAGIGDGDTVVAYDCDGGVFAARIVWMLRAAGHEAALLDGGIASWDGELEVGTHEPEPTLFTVRAWPPDMFASCHEVEALAAEYAGGGAGADVLLDAREFERYAGKPDDNDPRAGHIPGARSLPCRENLDSHDRLLPKEVLRERLSGVGVADEHTPVISSCGSGVTACHTLLVMEHVGLGVGRLYAGSWSQWSRGDRPVVEGPHPC